MFQPRTKNSNLNIDYFTIELKNKALQPDFLGLSNNLLENSYSHSIIPNCFRNFLLKFQQDLKIKSVSKKSFRIIFFLLLARLQENLIIEQFVVVICLVSFFFHHITRQMMIRI